MTHLQIVKFSNLFYFLYLLSLFSSLLVHLIVRSKVIPECSLCKMAIDEKGHENGEQPYEKAYVKSKDGEGDDPLKDDREPYKSVIPALDVQLELSRLVSETARHSSTTTDSACALALANSIPKMRNIC